MKRLFFFCYSVIVISQLYPQQFSVYQSETVMTYSLGAHDNQFLLDWASTEPNGPTAIGFDAEGKTYISDPIKKRLLVLNRSLNITSSYSQLYSEYVRNITVEGAKIYSYNPFYMLCDEGYEKSFFINLHHSVNSKSVSGTSVDFSVFNNLVLIHNPQGVLYSIINPGTDPAENNRRMLDANQTRALFDNPTAHGLDDVTLDSKNRLFMSGELVTRNYEAFATFQIERYKLDTFRQYADIVTHRYRPNNYSGQGVQYLDRDTKKNWYWFISIPELVCVINPDGIVIDLFYAGRDMRQTTPAIHPSGDVYFLDYDKNNVFVKRIQNVWDPAGREAWYATHSEDSTTAKQYARITSTNVRVREQPTLQGKQLGYVQTNDTVEILERSTEMMRIDTMNNYWYKIRKPDGMEGWVYGEFVELKN